MDSDISVKESKNFENTLFKINDFENQLSESDFNTLSKSLTKAVERIDNNQNDTYNLNTSTLNQKSNELDSVEINPINN